MAAGTEIERVQGLDYRLKDHSRPANWYRAHLQLDDGSAMAEDWWHLADGDWGAGFFQNSACNFCDDVVAETADIAFGDAWVEPYSSDGRGTNVVVVRSRTLHALLERGITECALSLELVDRDFVEATQAAGLRHRREGLAYRLTWHSRGQQPRKRVEPNGKLPIRRKLIYRMRHLIARGSHPMFRLARWLRMPGLYVAWARFSLRPYQALAWGSGKLGRTFDRLLGPAKA